MKIEHLNATVTEISGHYQDGVKFPDGTEGRIEFSFTYEGEFGFLTVKSGVLVINDNASVTFSKSRTTFYSTKIGQIPEDLDYSEIVFGHFERVSDLVKDAEVEVKFKGLKKCI